MFWCNWLWYIVEFSNRCFINSSKLIRMVLSCIKYVNVNIYNIKNTFYVLLTYLDILTLDWTRFTHVHYVHMHPITLGIYKCIWKPFNRSFAAVGVLCILYKSIRSYYSLLLQRVQQWLNLSQFSYGSRTAENYNGVLLVNIVFIG